MTKAKPTENATLLNILKTLESTNKTLQEILRWIRFANMSRLKEILGTELDSDEKKLTYENTNGVNGLKEVATISGAPQKTVYNWWQRWFRLCLTVESEIRKGRMMKIVSLDDVGIAIPKKITAKSISETTVKQPSVANHSTSKRDEESENE